MWITVRLPWTKVRMAIVTVNAAVTVSPIQSVCRSWPRTHHSRPTMISAATKIVRNAVLR